MGKIIVQIEYEGAYPILVQDVEWALQAQAPNRKVIVSEIKEQEEEKNINYGTSGLPVIYKTPKGSIPPILRLDEGEVK